MKAIAISVICRCIAFVSILAFVFGLIYISGNYGFLWLLFLLFTCYFVPTYESGFTNNRTDEEQTDDNNS